MLFLFELFETLVVMGLFASLIIFKNIHPYIHFKKMSSLKTLFMLSYTSFIVFLKFKIGYHEYDEMLDRSPFSPISSLFIYSLLMIHVDYYSECVKILKNRY